MNSDDIVSTIGNIVFNPDTGYGVVTSSGTIATIGAVGSTTASTVTISPTPVDLLSKWEMNNFAVDHKVSEQEILKLKEVAPDYANEIKENIAKNLARDITRKVTFTKKKEVDSDTHHFIGRVWCFTTEELKQLIEDARNA